MNYQDCLTVATAELAAASKSIQKEIRNYPTPISRCDAQFNYLIGLRGSISVALRALETPHIVATPRT